jgi:putative transposase
MYDVSKAAPEDAIQALGAAFDAFFAGRAGYPRFKPKTVKPSFRAANGVGRFRAEGKRIKLPIIGWVRMREAVRFSGPMKRATVSY